MAITEAGRRALELEGGKDLRTWEAEELARRGMAAQKAVDEILEEHQQAPWAELLEDAGAELRDVDAHRRILLRQKIPTSTRIAS